jgi:hypothetical protein
LQVVEELKDSMSGGTEEADADELLVGARVRRHPIVTPSHADRLTNTLYWFPHPIFVSNVHQLSSPRTASVQLYRIRFRLVSLIRNGRASLEEVFQFKILEKWIYFKILSSMQLLEFY